MNAKTPILIAAIASIAAIMVAGYLLTSFPERERPNVERIRVGVLPDEDVADLHRRHKPLLAHLNRQTGLAFDLVAPDSYADLLDRFAKREIDLAYLGGFTFVKAHLDYGADPLVMRDVDLRFTTYFVARTDGPLRDCRNLDCDGLEGSVISFGSRLSTSGHLMPRHFLKAEKGVEPEAFFGEVRYSGAHDRTVFHTRDGAVDLGAVNSEIYNTMQRDRRLAQDALCVVWETPPYPDNVWAVSERLPEGLRTKLRDAFLALDYGDPAHKQILALMGARGFLPAGSREFEPLRQIARSLDLLPAP